MDQRLVNPVNANTPRNYINTNPLGSDFAGAYSLTTTWGLSPELDKAILQVIPKQFGAFKWYLKSAKQDSSGKEFNWLQAQYPNMPILVKTNTAPVVAVPGSTVTQTIPVQDISIPALMTGMKVHYPDGTQGVTSAVVRTPGAASMTVTSMFSVGLSGVTAGDIMPNHGSVAGDGTWGYDNSFTSDLQRYSNIVEAFYDMTRIDRAEEAQLRNQQQVDFIAQRKRELMHRVMAANEARLWLGQYGLGTIPGNAFFNNGTPYNVTFTRGILQSMAADGVATQTTTTATAMDDIHQKIEDNALLAGTDKWLMFGTREKLQAIGSQERSQRVRYAPGETKVTDQVTAYEFFDGLQVTPVPVDAWKDVAYYGNLLRNDIILIPDGTADVGISLRYQMGIPMIEMQEFRNINSGMAQYSEYVIRGQWGAQVKKAFTYGRFTLV